MSPDSPASGTAPLLAQALTLYRSGQLAEARAIYTELLPTAPADPHLLTMLGSIALQLGDAAAAVAHLERSLAAMPAQPAAAYNRALALANLGRHEEAVTGYNQVLMLSPGHANACNNRGNALRQLGRPQEALASFEQAIALQPQHAEAFNNRGDTLQQLGRLQEALDSIDCALVLNPRFAAAHYNRGITLHALDRFEDALASYDRALALDPQQAAAHYNRGITLKELCRFEEALASYDHALALDPNYADAWWGKAILLLLLGDYAQGWRLFEWRWQATHIREHARHFAQPLWLGETPIAKRTLLIHAEQGYGDVIQFCRYAPLLAAAGAKIVFDVPASLQPLLATLAGQPVFAASTAAAFDCQCPIMSLPLACATTLHNIPASVPYLHAEAGRCESWARRLGNPTRPRIGLAWSGTAQHRNDRRRSLPLAALEPLLQLPLDFHALQKDIRTEDAALAASFPNLHLHAEALADFADTAALAEAMDLVISVDTSVAHLAGALGKTLWILLPHMPDYRWMLARADSPWYPSATLLRQPAAGDWGNVITHVVALLRQRYAAF